MSDRKPPRSAGDEFGVQRALWQFQRQSFVDKLDGVSEADAAASAVGSGTSLLWLANHLADAERLWIFTRFRGHAPDGLPGHADTVAGALDRYRRTWAEVDAVIDQCRPEDPCSAFDDDPTPVNLRWIVGHLLEETARHAGHADILRELIDGQTGR